MGYHREDAIQSNYRWTFATWGFAMVVLLNAYRTVLFSILTVPHYFQLVNNVDELVNRTEINVHVLKSSSVEDLFLVWFIHFILHCWVTKFLSNFYQNPPEERLRGFGNQLRRNPEQRIPMENLERVFEVIDKRNVLIAVLKTMKTLTKLIFFLI